MRVEHHSAPPQKPLRRLARASSSGRGDRVRKDRHFIEPEALTDGQKGRILKALAKREIGDDASRRLFVAAAEYEIADFQQCVAEDETPPPTPHPRPSDPQLAAIAKRARTLSADLEGLPEATRALIAERLTKANGKGPPSSATRFLAQLQCEVGRIAELPVSETPEHAPEPEAFQSVRHLIASLAHIFEGCFEQPATADPDAAFSGTLAVLATQLELPVSLDEAILTDLLGTET